VHQDNENRIHLSLGTKWDNRWYAARDSNRGPSSEPNQYEIRCYIRDPDGHLIEVGQTTDPEGDWSPAHWPSSTSE